MSEISELKKTCEEKKGVPTGADTRLITPYTIYLLRKFEWQKSEVKKKNGFLPWQIGGTVREWSLALLEKKPQPSPAESSSAFFMPVNTLFFQNLRENEKIRKSVLHALIERIQASWSKGGS